jgi:hypothetical protein
MAAANVEPSALLCALACEETGAAVDGASLPRVEGHGGRLATLRAHDGNFDATTNAFSLRRHDRGDALVLRLLAWFTSFRRVLQPLITEEDLFACRPDELLSAIYTFDDAISEFHLDFVPFSVDSTIPLHLHTPSPSVQFKELKKTLTEDCFGRQTTSVREVAQRIS